MRANVLHRLCCPECRGDLELLGAAPAEIESGLLRCGACAREFPIVRGIPRLLPDRLTAGAARTAAAFGYEWEHYPRDNPYTVEQFLDWISPLPARFFRHKVVVDAGCGTGGFAAYAADFGAREVLALDLSPSVEVAARHARTRANLTVVQGSIDAAPIKSGVDFVFSIGVVHHLESPAAGIRSLAGLLRPGGELFVWVYGRENNELLLALLLPLRRLVRRIPFTALKWGVAAPLACVLFPALRLAYRRRPGASSALRRLPYLDYLHWLSQYSLSYVHGVVLDQLIAPTAFYLRRDEVEGAFRAAGLVDVRTSQRNGNSWRALGAKPLAASLAPTLQPAPA